MRCINPHVEKKPHDSNRKIKRKILFTNKGIKTYTLIEIHKHKGRTKENIRIV